jgi:hypothetical protein
VKILSVLSGLRGKNKVATPKRETICSWNLRKNVERRLSGEKAKMAENESDQSKTRLTGPIFTR